VDDGVGGADPQGGTGLAGLRARIDALDGDLHIISPAGGPTQVRMTCPILGRRRSRRRGSWSPRTWPCSERVSCGFSNAGNCRPDLVVTDIRMPPTHSDEGLRAAATIRAPHPGIAIMLLSAYVADAYRPHLLARLTAS
jgi:CheY-like chemotaxis protein